MQLAAIGILVLWVGVVTGLMVGRRTRVAAGYTPSLAEEKIKYYQFQLLAQLEIAVSSYEKWKSIETYDQVTIAYKKYKEVTGGDQ